MIELEKCPLCGGKAELRENLYEDYYIKRYYTVHCTECSCSVGNTNVCLTKEEAIREWNRRVSRVKW